MNIFKCKHPAAYLRVDKAATREQRDEDFDVVEYHLFCTSCRQNVKLRYAEMRGGVAEFLNRSRQKAGLPAQKELTVLPILENHDQRAQIGFTEAKDGYIHVHFLRSANVTLDRLHEIFGNIGYQILEQYEEGSVIYVKKCRILEWSFSRAGIKPAGK